MNLPPSHLISQQYAFNDMLQMSVIISFHIYNLVVNFILVMFVLFSPGILYYHNQLIGNQLPEIGLRYNGIIIQFRVAFPLEIRDPLLFPNLRKHKMNHLGTAIFFGVATSQTHILRCRRTCPGNVGTWRMGFCSCLP